MYTRDPEAVEVAALRRVVDIEGASVLEVGCGKGRLTGFLADRASHVHAFDPDCESVAEAKRSLSRDARRRVSFAVHSAEAVDVPRRRFDLALCGWSL